ncbi:MAG TPA: hypothetical protein VGE12_01520 [Noviherbaspirillum sp.]
MIEKTEWEVVDDPAQRADGASRTRYHHAEYESWASREAGPTPEAEARRAAKTATAAMLGPWWKWKLAGVAVIALVVFAFFATMIGIAALTLVALAVAGAGVRKLLQWMRGDRRTDVMRL